MANELFISLIYNTSLLLVLVAIYSGITYKFAHPSSLKDIFSGLLIGFIGVAVMANPWTLRSGIVFDVRSILLAVTGLFFGALPTALAVVITGAFRLFSGGAGVWAGLGVIITSAGLGLLWRRLRPDLKQQGGLLELYLFGLSVHLSMLACMLIMPWPLALDVLRHISAPVLFVYPIGTVLLSIILIHQRANRQLDETLLESKKLFESVVENVPLMIFLKDAVDLRFVLFNRAGEKLLGHDRKDLLGKSDQDFFPPAQAEFFMAKDREVLKSGGLLDISEEPVETADKGRRLLHTKKVCVNGPDGVPKYLLGISEDITGSKRAVEALRDSEAGYRTLFGQARDSILVLEIVPAGDPVIRDLNEAALQELGYSREELVGSPVSILHESGDDAVSRLKNSFGPQWGKGVVFEVRHKRKDGSVFTVEASGREVSIGGKRLIISVERNITEKKKSAERLEQINSALLALGPDASKNLGMLVELFGSMLGADCAMYNRLEGETFSVRAFWGDCLERTEFKAEGSPCSKVLASPQAERGLVFKDLSSFTEASCLAGKGFKSYFGLPVKFESGKGVVCVLYKRTSDPSEEDHKLLGIIASAIGMEEARCAGETAAREGELKLRQAQKMEAVGLLAGGIAHDFNNILTAIKGYCSLVDNALIQEDPSREDLREIMNAADRATTLTRQLLAFSRKQIMAPKVVDLNKTISDMLKMLRRIIGEDIKLTTKLFSAPCLVKVDPGQIEQVVVNLVLNARDAVSKDGEIIMETEVILPPEEFFLARPDLARGRLVCVNVRDNGCGITPEVKKHMFEPFYTTKEQGKGTGLGLSMVYGTVKQSGGDIAVESEPGKGCVFKLYFPLLEKAAPEINAGREEEASKGGSETILLVEDEESLRRLGERVLRAGGYAVISAADGKAALEAAELYGKPVDLLLTDLVMPGMSGRELALELTRRKLVRRTLYMSGYTDEAIVKHGVLEPGVTFMYKPFAIDALSVKVREVLDGPADQAKA